MRNKPLQLAGRLAALGAFAAGMTGAGSALAQTPNTPCASMPKPVIIVGSSAVSSFVQTVATALAGLDDPITVQYISPGSCFGYAALLHSTGDTQFVVGGDSPTVVGTTTGASASTWNATGTKVTCDFPVDAPVDIDIAVADVFPATCGVTVPSGMKEYRGPVQSMTFAAYKDSDYHVMSGEAAYLTFGLGNDSQTPWNDVTQIFVRDKNSGTQQMIAAAIGVPAASFLGSSTNAGGIISGLQGSALVDQDTINKSIGILGMDAIRGNCVGTGAKCDVVPLAYQHFGQTGGYYPSSSLQSNDMQNTRDGHYMIQGPVHLVTSVSGGNAVNASAKVLIDYLTGATVPTGFDLIQLEADKSIVPDCAMRVSRDGDAAPFVSYMPEHSCECKFLMAATQDVPAECTECSSNDDCGSDRPVCNYGYCEVQ